MASRRKRRTRRSKSNRTKRTAGDGLQRIICHWTGSGYEVGSKLRKTYNFIIDGDGTIVHKFTGPVVRPDILYNQLRQVL